MTNTDNPKTPEKKSLKEKLKLDSKKKKTVFFSILTIVLVGTIIAIFSVECRYSNCRHHKKWSADFDRHSHYNKKGPRFSSMQSHGGEFHRETLSQYDENGDGHLSRTEYQQAKVERFNEIDDNQNNQLENEEFINFFLTSAEQRLKGSFILMDLNEDNILSKKEYSESRDFIHRHDRKRSSFKTADTDNNSELDSREFITTSLSPINRKIKARFVMLDRDGNNVLSQKEFNFPAMPRKAF